MNIQERLPKKITTIVAALCLGMGPYDVRWLVVSKQIQSESYEEIPVESIGKYLMEKKGWDQPYVETFLFEKLCQNL
jgi:hypothetical protein